MRAKVSKPGRTRKRKSRPERPKLCYNREKMGKITRYLNQLIVGNVFDSAEILEAYATDQSALRIKPKFVAFPESTDDIRKLMRFFDQIAAKEIPVSVTPRGSGTDEGGADLSSGLVISTERLNKMLEIDPRERLVRVQAGITLKELNTALSVSGLMIPIAGHDNATIGGLIAGAPVDENAGKYGGIRQFVRRAEVVLASGEVLQTSKLGRYLLAKKVTENNPEGELYKKIVHLLKTREKTLTEMRQEVQHSQSGYPAISKMSYRETIDLLPLFFGSQGTLGIVSEVILKAVPLTSRPSRVVATFKRVDQALEFARKVRNLAPRAVNLYDLRIIQEAHKSGKNLDGVIRKLEGGFVVFVSFDERASGALKKVTAMQRELPRTAKFVLESSKNAPILDEFENALTTYLNAPKNSERVPILTDFYLPLHSVSNFLEDLALLEQKTGLELALFGSTATSVYSLRPEMRLEDEKYSQQLASLLRAGAYAVERQGGDFTGGTPEGRVKAAVTNPALRPEFREVYEELKDIFDPHHILNPDVKLGANSKFTLTHLRTSGLGRVML